MAFRLAHIHRCNPVTTTGTKVFPNNRCQEIVTVLCCNKRLPIYLHITSKEARVMIRRESKDRRYCQWYVLPGWFVWIQPSDVKWSETESCDTVTRTHHVTWRDTRHVAHAHDSRDNMGTSGQAMLSWGWMVNHQLLCEVRGDAINSRHRFCIKCTFFFNGLSARTYSGKVTHEPSW